MVTEQERRARMRRLRRWVDEFLEAAIARDLRDFPVVEEYVPEAASSSARFRSN